MLRETTSAASSVQTRAKARYGLTRGPDSFVYFNAFQRLQKIYDVPRWGLGGRDRSLRVLSTLAGNEPVQAALSSDVQKVQSTTWVLEGPARVAKQVHAVLHNANFGQGIDDFLAKGVVDYRTQDNGMFV